MGGDLDGVNKAKVTDHIKCAHKMCIGHIKCALYASAHFMEGYY